MNPRAATAPTMYIKGAPGPAGRILSGHEIFVFLVNGFTKIQLLLDFIEAPRSSSSPCQAAGNQPDRTVRVHTMSLSRGCHIDFFEIPVHSTPATKLHILISKPKGSAQQTAPLPNGVKRSTMSEPIKQRTNKTTHHRQSNGSAAARWLAVVLGV